MDKGIWIDNDLTRNEREIQSKLRIRAREERENGEREVRVGYQKIYLRGRWVGWNAKKDRLMGEDESKQ